MSSSAIFILRLTREAGGSAFETPVVRRFTSKPALVELTKSRMCFARTDSNARPTRSFTWANQKNLSSFRPADLICLRTLATSPRFFFATSGGSDHRTETEHDEFYASLPTVLAATLGGGASMKHSPVKDVVAFLSFSRGDRDPSSSLKMFSAREWKYVLQWLDDAGLAFYFLQKLKDTHTAGIAPPLLLSRLERNFASNQLRIDDMARRFDAINRGFNDAGVRYAVIKGFSLVPQFCPYAALRHQADLDYLVDEPSLPAACHVLVEAGYRPQKSRSSKESIFVTPGGEPSHSDEQYSPHAPHAVELHTDIWDSEMHRMPPIPNPFSVSQVRTQHWNGLMFPAQSDQDAFLLQVLHACHHVFTQWIRLSCLFEIAYFLHRRASDTQFWSGIEQRVGDNAILREFVVIVTEVAAQLFAAPVPELVRSWGAEIRPGPRTWIEHYSRDWALSALPIYEFGSLPCSKLALFLHQQYRREVSIEESRLQSKWPSSRDSRIALSIKSEPSLLLSAAWWRRQHFLRRSIFFTLAALRYAVEIPRWRRRTRASEQSSAAAPWPTNSLRSKKAS